VAETTACKDDTLAASPNKASSTAHYQSLIDSFLKSRNSSLATSTLEFYQFLLTKASKVVGVNVSGLQIKTFLDNLPCSNGGRHGDFTVVLPIEPRWLTTTTSFGDFRSSSGHVFFAGLFTVKEVDADKRAIIGTPLIIGIPEMQSEPRNA